jgi:curved DNA-binding protein CbpA
MKNEVPASGSLKRFSLTKILNFFKNQQKTGVLTFENGNVKKSIYIKNGDAVFASSNQDEDRLGEMLISAGKITPEQYDESVKLLKKADKRQGMIFVDLGYLTPKQLFQEVKNQIKGIIISLFLWEDGTFSFKESVPSDEIITLNISMEKLIQEGLKIKKKKEKEEEGYFIQKVNELYDNIVRLTFYDILEINIDTPGPEIKKAYLKAAKNYHPDKHIDLPDPDMKDKLTLLFTLVNKAYDTLSNETEKANYDSILLKKTAAHVPESETILAEKQFERGLAELKSGNAWGAVDSLRWAIRIVPDKASYWAHLSLALSKMTRRHKEAEETILKAIELEPHNTNYYIHLGMIYVNSGMTKRAVQQFKTALTWDPTNTKAQKELEKLQGKK